MTTVSQGADFGKILRCRSATMPLRLPASMHHCAFFSFSVLDFVMTTRTFVRSLSTRPDRETLYMDLPRAEVKFEVLLCASSIRESHDATSKITFGKICSKCFCLYRCMSAALVFRSSRSQGTFPDGEEVLPDETVYSLRFPVPALTDEKYNGSLGIPPVHGCGFLVHIGDIDGECLGAGSRYFTGAERCADPVRRMTIQYLTKQLIRSAFRGENAHPQINQVAPIPLRILTGRWCNDAELSE
ncbi:hypothetical protein B0H13DRAFT_2057646 [Mycena leptocephala]|nr:hypothetical protein B0H13DRAFT_2057646 [Mycena leptocephala]